MFLIEWLVALLLFFGGVFTFLGSLALVKFPDFFTRLHGPTKAGTLGAGLCLLGSTLYFSAKNGHLSIEEIVVLIFLVMTAPVSAHMIGLTALHKKNHDKTHDDTPT
jgi:multicomponent K+:H+ antiporter subunit G